MKDQIINIITKHLEGVSPKIREKVITDVVSLFETEQQIVFHHWDYQCADGCCTDSGVELILNGNKLEHPESTEQEDVPNMYIGDDSETAIAAVLKELGINFKIENHYPK